MSMESFPIENSSIFLDFEKEEAKKHILVVEDDKDFLNNISDLLEDNKYSVIRASDGQAGIMVANARKGDIDLIITDCCMPKMDGLQMSKKIHKEYPNIPIILLSSEIINGQEILLKKMGIKAYLSKSQHFDDIYSIIKKFLKK